MKIRRTTDRIPVKIDEVTFYLAPLSNHQKAEIQSMLAKGQKDGDLSQMAQAINHTVRVSVKDVRGLSENDNTPFQLSFENGVMTEECLSILLNLPLSGKLTNVCGALVNNVPDSFNIEGVEIEKK